MKTKTGSAFVQDSEIGQTGSAQRRMLLAVLAAAIALLLGLMMMAPQQAQASSGNCGANGDNVTWDLNTSTGVLTISGSGAMADYTSASDAPWFSDRQLVKSATIGQSVTHIGNFVFGNCAKLSSISIPSSVTSIGTFAFIACSSLYAYVPQGCSIGTNAFYNAKGYEMRTCVAKPSSGSANYVYDGTEKQCTPAVEAAAVTGRAISGVYSATDAGDYTCYISPASGYMWENGTTASVTYTMVIARAAHEYDLSGISFADGNVTYDGQPHSLAVSGDLPQGVSVSYEGNGRVDAGTYTVTAIFSVDANHETASMSATLAIAPKPDVAVPEAVSGLVYSGQGQTGVVAGEGYTLAGVVNATDADTYTATAHLRDPNHAWEDGTTADKEITWSIAPKTIAVPVAVFTDLVYDGSEQQAVYLLDDGYILSGTIVAVDAGTYMFAAFLKNTNHAWEDGTTADKEITWSIAKAAYDMSGVTFASCKATYDGKAHSIKISGELPGGVTVSYTGNGKINAGTYTVTAYFSGDSDNYEAVPMTATLTISKAVQSAAKVTTATKTVKGLKKGKLKKNRTFLLAKSGVKGGAKVTWKKLSGNAKITINAKTGRVTVKKGIRKGSYKVKVRMTIAACANYLAKTVTKTIIVKVR